MPALSADAWWLQQLLGVGLVLAWLSLLALAAVAVRRRWNGQREWSRKLLHIGSGLVIPLAWWSGIDRWVAIPAAAAVTLLALLNHRQRLLPAIEDVGRRSYGTVAYGASITVLLLLFWPARADAACAGVLVMAVGDGLAGLLGQLLSSPSWQVMGERRSLVGTLSMALGSLLMLLAVAWAAGPAAPGLPLLLLLTLLATGLEQVALLGVDNLSVPLGVGLIWALAG